MTSAEKTHFRGKKIWKEFRASIIKKQNSTCVLCGTKFIGKRKKLLQLHHLDEENYTELNPEKFALLCSDCHDLVEKMIPRIEKKPAAVPHLKEWCSLLNKLYSNHADAKSLYVIKK